jgi:hypothetical protein
MHYLQHSFKSSKDSDVIAFKSLRTIPKCKDPHRSVRRYPKVYAMLVLLLDSIPLIGIFID